MRRRNYLYRSLFELSESMHRFGDSRQQDLADQILTQLHVHLESRGLTAEDVGWKEGEERRC